MNFDEVVRQRRSVRGFQPDRRVPGKLLEEVLELAQKSPSNCNAQPWSVVVAGGKVCDRLRRRLVARASAGEPFEEDATPNFRELLRARQVACALELYGAMEIARDDKPGRQRALLRNFELFDAPHVAILCMPSEFDVGVAVDIGCYLQTLMLALWARGVASCAQASLRCYASTVKEQLDIAPELRVLCGVAFGYELESSPANRARQRRAPVRESVRLIGFDE